MSRRKRSGSGSGGGRKRAAPSNAALAADRIVDAEALAIAESEAIAAFENAIAAEMRAESGSPDPEPAEAALAEPDRDDFTAAVEPEIPPSAIDGSDGAAAAELDDIELDRIAPQAEEPRPVVDPYAVLAEYERRSFAHVVASADQVQAPGLWRGIAFRVGSRRLMASITEVSEILPVLHHTTVPGTQAWLLGVVNVRGTLVPLVDLRGYIEGGRTPLGDTSRMLLARHGTNAIGLLVEEVLGQRNLTAENDALKVEQDDVAWARFVPAHFELDGKLWGVFSMNALVSAPDFLHAAA